MEVSKRVVLWITATPLIVQFCIWGVARESWFYQRIIESESGIVELATAFLLAPAAIFAMRAARSGQQQGLRILPALMVVFAIGCVFLAGEELSWGQHAIGWSTPDYFIAHNIQDETNLHNLESFNKNLLKWIVVVAIGIGGIASLFLDKLRSQDGLWSNSNSIIWIMPTQVCLLAAIITLSLHVFTKVLGWNGIEMGEAWGINLRETTELYISIFFFLYAWSLLRRLTRS